MGKTICEWSKKDLEKDNVRLYKITKDATFYCSKCGRVANKKKALCKPAPFLKFKSPTQE